MLTRLPILPGAMVLGAVIAGVCGAIAGGVIGIAAYPPTAWFAVIELGLPAAFVGAVLGLLIGLLLLRRQRPVARH